MTDGAQRQVLFLCVENACRSLMAEAIFNADPPAGWRASSAGTRPATGPNARTGPMLAEIGLEIPAHPPVLVTREMMDGADLLVNMGCLDDASCPAHLREVSLRDWNLEDPARLDDDGFRRIRDRLVDRVRGLRTELGLLDRRARARLGSGTR